MAWNIVHTNSDRGEEILKSILKRTDPECQVWVPKIRTKIICGDREATKAVSLYEDYLFVSRVTPKTRNYIEKETANYAEPILQILWEGNKAAELSQRDIQIIKGYDANPKIRRVVVGSSVTVTHPFAILKGKIAQINKGVIEVDLFFNNRVTHVFYPLAVLHENMIREIRSSVRISGDVG